ncbi:hypothetical protein [Mycoplasma sp. E35C]|uniref:hypothetical protein n=1 Tax=Mycoplasma sp. E35C TaxID=2801918 RepID=UPI001CA41222|nr:hypothetical protein [Mycoplasma sp. E35C]QZX49478.1 hypothetical protein JJE79_01895 [Mycoplasma sp. E35C]
MKKKILHKLITTFSFVSFSSLVLSSCVNVESIKAGTEPPSDTDKNKGGGDNVNKPINGSPNDQTPPADKTGPVTDFELGDQPHDFDREIEEVQTYLDSLNEESFKLVQSKDNDQELDKSQTDVDQVTSENFKLVNASSNSPEGWKSSYALTTSQQNATVTLTVSLQKESVTLQSQRITFSGFKQISQTISSSLITDVKVGEKDHQTDQKALDLGSAEFKTLVDLNKQESSSPNATTLGLTEGLLKSFNDNGVNKDKIQSVLSSSPKAQKENFYIIGKAKVENAWKNEGDFHVNFYLTPKENEKLYLGIKNTDLKLEIPGILIKDIIPDDLELTISKLKDNIAQFDASQQSNLEAYKNLINSEADSSKYRFNESTQRLTFTTDAGSTFRINPLQIPYIEQKNNHKILFKVRYIFDGQKVNYDFWRTKVRYKKIVRDNNLTSEAISSSELNNNDNLMNFYNNNTNGNVDTDSKFFWTGTYYSITDNNVDSTDTEIWGDQNKDNGDGVYQMVNWKANSNSNNRDELMDSNKDEASNYILYTRIGYNKENADSFAHYWPKTLTILHINNKK